MALKFGFRFHNYLAAKAVLPYAAALTNVSLGIEKEPSTDTRDDPPGDYMISAPKNDLNIFQTNRLSDCVGMATQLALADELRRYNPHHPLLTIWHLRPENREKVGHYNLTNSEGYRL